MTKAEMLAESFEAMVAEARASALNLIEELVTAGKLEEAFVCYGTVAHILPVEDWILPTGSLKDCVMYSCDPERHQVVLFTNIFEEELHLVEHGGATLDSFLENTKEAILELLKNPTQGFTWDW